MRVGGRNPGQNPKAARSLVAMLRTARATCARIGFEGTKVKISRNLRFAVSGGLVVAVLATGAVPAAADEDTVDGAKLLYPKVEQIRPLPGPRGHDYKFQTSVDHWTVVAAKPIGRTDVNLHMFDDKAHTQLLSTSSYGAGRTDFIAVDTHHRPYGGYFPHVTTQAGTGSYRIELVTANPVFDDDDETVEVSASDVVIARDTWLSAGTEYAFGVGGVHGAIMYLVGSHPDIPSSWVRSRAEAIDSTPIGGFQVFSYTPTRSDWFAVVVTLPGGVAGEVTMIRES